MFYLEGQTIDYINSIAISDLIPMYNPSMKKFYHYNGSLTTPPCYEVVNWYVFEDPIYISQDQVRTILAPPPACLVVFRFITAKCAI